ncbi:UDP-glucuronosyltransferase [Mycobacterium adipatum]|uniref:UDP-glucuronosyltransferase n=1 Tax=Mycobacterium adipatum TaxID=1682113 RepID=A0A172UW30_9MYCO|nr:UDP-glucuronosyltransferase [Mycobacterium adipatum]
MPMIDIGAGLRALGHDVTLLTGPGFVEPARRAGLPAMTLPDDVHIDPPSAAPALLRRAPVQLRRFWLGRAELDSVFAKPLCGEDRALRAALRSSRFDAVLADVTFTGAVPLLLQDGRRPPVVVCNVGPLTLSSADVPPFGMAWQPEAGVDYRPMTAVAHRLIMRGSQRRFDRALRRAGSRRSPVFISDWPRLADAVVALSVREFEYPRSDLPPTVDFVGPVLAAKYKGDRALPPWWPDVQRAGAVVHVTQGTFDNTDLDQLIAPTMAALGDRDDLLVVVTTARPDARLSAAIPANARVADWLPYSALMPHVDVMVTNGGYGGVHYALSHGVPLVVAGETSDKAEVAARVDHTGVGVDLGTSTPTAAAIRAAVDHVLRDDRYRRAARRMQRAIDATAPIDAIANTLKRAAG